MSQKKKKTSYLGTFITAIVFVVLFAVWFILGSASISGLGLFGVDESYLVDSTTVSNAFSWWNNFSDGSQIAIFSWLGLACTILAAVFIIAAIIVMCVKRRKRVTGYGIATIILTLVWYYAMDLIGVVEYQSGFNFDNYVATAISFNAYDYGGRFTTDVLTGVYYIVFLVLLLVGVLLVFTLYCKLFADKSHARKKVPVSALASTTASEKPAELVAKETAPVAAVEEKPVETATSTTPETKEGKRKVILTVKRYDSCGNGAPVVERSTNYPREPLNVQPLSKEDIRDIIRDELARKETEDKAKAYDRLVEELKNKPCTPRVGTVEPTVAPETTVSKESTKVTPTPIIVTIPNPIKEEVVKAEEPSPVKEEVKEEPSLTKDDVRSIIKEELVAVLKDLKDSRPEPPKGPKGPKEPHTIVIRVPRQVVKETVVTEEAAPTTTKEEVKEEAPKADEATVSPRHSEVVTSESAAPATEEKKVEEAPVVAPSEPTPAPVATESVEEATSESTKVERIPFATRMKSASPELREHYNQLKSLLLSYGLKNRVANGGDTFRLHRVTYCKITIAGKALKLYLALDPNDYKNTTLPIKDASSKAIYKDIPLTFKVKSELSYRRAEQLIRDCMEKHGVEQIDQVHVEDWASRLDEEAAQALEGNDEEEFDTDDEA